MSETDPITEKGCEKCENVLHARINERAPWRLLVPMLLALLAGMTGAYGYAYSSTDKIEARQWAFSERMVTQADFREFKQENNIKLDRIQAAIDALR